MSETPSVLIRNIVFSTPEPPDELGSFYAHLLGWKVLRTDWFVIAPGPDILPRLAFGDGPGAYRAPRWPDPEYPQQMHVDIAVPDLGAAADAAANLGATELKDNGTYRVLADPAGHPFCLCEPHDGEIVAPVVTHVVIDCLSPRMLGTFYEGLLGMTRKQDSEKWVRSRSAGWIAPRPVVPARDLSRAALAGSGVSSADTSRLRRPGRARGRRNGLATGSYLAAAHWRQLPSLRRPRGSPVLPLRPRGLSSRGGTAGGSRAADGLDALCHKRCIGRRRPGRHAHWSRRGGGQYEEPDSGTGCPIGGISAFL